MTRHALTLAALSLLAATGLPSCAHRAQDDGVILIDLNRTATGDMTLVSVLTADSATASISPDASGVYAAHADTLPQGIYLAKWDDNHCLPLVVRHGAAQRLCGTWQEWDKITASDPDTRAAISAERLLRRLTAATDAAISAQGGLSSAERCKAAADSIMELREAARAEADALLATLPDTSLAAAAILGLPGLYADVADYRLLARRFGRMAASHPDIAQLRRRAGKLAMTGRLISLNERMGAGGHAPDFTFVSERGDSVPSEALNGKKFAMVLMTDTLMATREAMGRVAEVVAGGARVFVEAPAGVELPQRPNCLRGRLAGLESRGDFEAFAPAVMSVGADGTVTSLWLGLSLKR